MKQLFVIILVFTLIFSCNNNEIENTNIPIEVQNSKAKMDTIQEVALWSDSLIKDYLEKNNLILDSTISYIKNLTKRNQKNYVIVKIGKNLTDRFVAEQQIYIDSLTKNIFLYNSSQDSLYLWKKN